MGEITYLRHLRQQYGIGLPELARLAHISPQHLSRLELRQVPCSQAQEEKIGQALEAWLFTNRCRINSLEWEYRLFRGKLLNNMEDSK